jgi:hypothetical protein
LVGPRSLWTFSVHRITLQLQTAELTPAEKGPLIM